MANATATSATGQSLFVNDDGNTTTLAPDSSWTPTTNGTFAKVYLRPGELTFDTQGNLVSPIQKVGYKGDFAANADLAVALAMFTKEGVEPVCNSKLSKPSLALPDTKILLFAPVVPVVKVNEFDTVL